MYSQSISPARWLALVVMGMLFSVVGYGQQKGKEPEFRQGFALLERMTFKSLIQV